MKIKRTYYVTEGYSYCNYPGRHWVGCDCGGYGDPAMLTNRPKWPRSLDYVRVRASTKHEAITIATSIGGMSCCADVGVRRVNSGGHEVEIARADYDVL